MVRSTFNSYDFVEGQVKPQLELKNIDINDLGRLSTQEISDLVMQYSESTDNGNTDADMEKLLALRDELDRRWKEEKHQYGQIRKTIENSHYENMDEANRLKMLLEEPDDVVAQKMPWLKSSENQDNGTENAESLKEQKIVLLQNMFDEINSIDIKMSNNLSGLSMDSDEFKRESANIAFTMLKKFQDFVIRNQESITKLGLTDDVNKLYTLGDQICKNEYSNGDVYPTIQSMFNGINHYVQKLEHTQNFEGNENSIVNSYYYDKYVGNGSIKNLI